MKTFGCLPGAPYPEIPEIVSGIAGDNPIFAPLLQTIAGRAAARQVVTEQQHDADDDQ